jgi:secreted trypsin-like serine protease
MSFRWISSARNRRVTAAVLLAAILATLPISVAAQPGGWLPGEPASAARYPYVAAFSRRTEDRRVYFCGGALIAPAWVATAAHCFFTPGGRQIGVDDLSVAVGRDRLGDITEDAQVPIARIFVHPDYDPPTQANDIALVRLGDIAGPLVAPPARAEAPSPDATALGFASLYEGELARRSRNQFGTLAAQLSDELRVAQLFLLDAAHCEPAIAAETARRVICAGTDARDTCVGDSGAPLVETSPEGDDRLIGIASRGSGCAVSDPFVVYTRVSAYADWIAATLAR